MTFLNGVQFMRIIKYGQLSLHQQMIQYWKTVKKNCLWPSRQKSRSAKTTFIIIDAQSVKNTDTAEHHGYDAGKNISGIKRHLAVDINGLPQAIHITTANVSDCDGASAMLAINSEYLSQVSTVLVDGGFQLFCWRAY